jgi:hypothetical protein
MISQQALESSGRRAGDHRNPRGFDRGRTRAYTKAAGKVLCEPAQELQTSV